MIRNLLAAATLSAAVFAAPAALAGQPMNVQLQSPIASPVKFVAGGATWRCEGAVCRADATTDRTLSVEGCRALAKEVGAVATYENFDAAKLAKCDAGFGASTVAKAAATPAGGTR